MAETPTKPLYDPYAKGFPDCLVPAGVSLDPSLHMSETPSTDPPDAPVNAVTYVPVGQVRRNESPVVPPCAGKTLAIVAGVLDPASI